MASQRQHSGITETPQWHHRDTSVASQRHHSGITEIPQRHHRDTTETPQCHHRDTTETPQRHHRDITETPQCHHRDTTETPQWHHRDTTETSLQPLVSHSFCMLCAFYLYVYHKIHICNIIPKTKPRIDCSITRSNYLPCKQ